MAIVKTEQEIQKKIDKVSDLEYDGSVRFNGMSYLEGVREALSWVLGDLDEDGDLLE